MLPETVKRRARTWQALYPAAIDLFYERGYEAATLRQLAAALGVQAGSIYNYVASKQELLFTIIRAVMEQLNAESRAVARAPGSIEERLRRLVEATVIFHATHTKEVFIGNHELRSLEPAHLARILTLRDEFEYIYQTLLDEGMRQAVFIQSDVKITSYALLAMCTGVSKWYRPTGRLDAACIASHYAEMAMRMVLIASKSDK